MSSSNHDWLDHQYQCICYSQHVNVLCFSCLWRRRSFDSIEWEIHHYRSRSIDQFFPCRSRTSIHIDRLASSGKFVEFFSGNSKLSIEERNNPFDRRSFRFGWTSGRNEPIDRRVSGLAVEKLIPESSFQSPQRVTIKSKRCYSIRRDWFKSPWSITTTTKQINVRQIDEERLFLFSCRTFAFNIIDNRSIYFYPVVLLSNVIDRLDRSINRTREWQRMKRLKDVNVLLSIERKEHFLVSLSTSLCARIDNGCL